MDLVGEKISRFWDFPGGNGGTNALFCWRGSLKDQGGHIIVERFPCSSWGRSGGIKGQSFPEVSSPSALPPGSFLRIPFCWLPCACLSFHCSDDSIQGTGKVGNVCLVKRIAGVPYPMSTSGFCFGNCNVFFTVTWILFLAPNHYKGYRVIKIQRHK